MTIIDRIRELMHTHPFRPFTVKLVDGSAHPITNLDFIAVSPGRRSAEIAFYVETGIPGRHKSHFINSNLVIGVILPGETEPDVPNFEANGA
jgi:hypothetical protein